MKFRGRERIPYFERPKHPRDWRFWVGGLGKVLITLGLLMFGFVAYQLWGTGLQTAQAQNRLDDDWADQLASTTTTIEVSTTTSTPHTTLPGDTTTSSSSTVPVAPTSPPVESGTAIARLKIPAIDLDWIVVEGVTPNDLKDGPGHFRETVMPGQLGNSVLAGHRTTYGAPFFDLDKLQPGDLITVETRVGTYVYEVTGSEVVGPNDYALVVPTKDPTVATLTLSTCHPAYTAKDRLIIRATLVAEQSSQVYAPPSATVPDNGPDTVPPTLPGDTLPGEDGTLPGDSDTTAVTADSTTDTVPAPTAAPIDESYEDAFTQGWFDDSAAWPHVLGWLALLTAICVGAYYAGKAARRLWVSFLVAIIPFVIGLYFFYENVNRLLPPGL